MIKDIFVLKKKSWHMWLMKYTWKLSHRDFSHICPYFWLSIFNVIIAPVFIPVKMLFKVAFPFLGKYIYKYGFLSDSTNKVFQSGVENPQ